MLVVHLYCNLTLTLCKWAPKDLWPSCCWCTTRLECGRQVKGTVVLYDIHPSIFNTGFFLNFGWGVCRSLSQLTLGKRQGDTLEKSPRQTTIRGQLTPTDNFPNYLTLKFCACLWTVGGKLIGSTQKRGELASSAQKDPTPGIEPTTFRQNSNLRTSLLHTPRHSLKKKMNK